MKSISSRIAIYFTVILLIVCVGLGFISYHNAKKTVINEVNKSLELLAVEKAKEVANTINIQLATMEVMAERERIKDLNNSWEDKLLILNKERQRSGHLMMSLADEKGSTHITNGKVINIADREYFKKALSGQKVISDPIVSKTDGSIIIILAVPIKEDSKVIGVLMAVRDGKELSNITNSITFGKTGKAFMLNKKGTTIAHNNVDLVLNQENDIEKVKTDSRLKSLVEIEKKMVAGETGTGEYEYNGEYKYTGFAPVPGTDWSLAIYAPKDEVLAGISSIQKAFSIATLIFLALGIIVALFLGSSITKPIKDATVFSETIAKGDLTRKPKDKHLARTDEIGRLAKAFSQMQYMLHNTIGHISNTAKELFAASEELSVTSQRASSDLEEVSASTEQISASLEEVFASAEEINASSQEMNDFITQLVKNMEQGNLKAKEIENRAIQLAENVVLSKQSAGHIYENLEARMKQGIEKAKVVEDISHMADAISGIAEQTNLLALNAAIEAARAGEQGRGFAVVAEEVRKLAADAATTAAKIQNVTKEVRENITTLIQDTNHLLNFMNTDVIKDYEAFLEAVNQYKEDAQVFFKITDDASIKGNQVLSVVNEVTSAISEVTSTINQSSEGAQIIAQGTEHSSKGAIQVNEASIKLAEMSEEVTKLIDKFKL